MLDVLEVRQKLPAPNPRHTLSHCEILPNSCELLSHSLECAVNESASASSSGQPPASVQVGLQLCALGSHWTPVLLLAGAGASSELAGDLSVLRHGRPLLMRAHVPDAVQDIVVRLQARLYSRETSSSC